ncbi:MAG: excinuclease ABC subunit UvrC [Lachnospiraceae bacterium]|jgi:excinuclease ABC subunit C|nr:excinuclease ABC subunit UvrC [Lachnospiraceae bacterium]
MNIEEELKKLPQKPGVYLMHDENDAILYVGKAVSLRNRVRSYFRGHINRGPKIDQMVKKIYSFEYIVTDSELEALVLENNLIKEHKPKYNTMLKDDKTYPYIKVTLGEEYPRILFSRLMKKDKSKYFGPYTSATAVKDTIVLMRKLYKIRTCNRNLPRDIGKERPCLNYHIHQCKAPCQGYQSKEEYDQCVAMVLEFLNGNYKGLIGQLEEKMEKASEDLRFEEAIEYRDLLNSVRAVAQKQKITESDGEDKDIIGMAVEEEDCVIQVFFVRGGRLIGREHFYMTHTEGVEKKIIIQNFIQQFYGGTPFIPKELMLQEEIEGRELIERWLTEKRGGRVYIRIPKKGKKEKLVELAIKNAAMILSQDKERLKREEKRTTGALKEIETILGVTSLNRIEAYDISNTNGFESVGSMIVYERGRPKRNDYRKFKIRSVEGPNDYASMKEVLNRRFIHGLEEKKEMEEKSMDKQLGSFTKFPDLIMMDGGKGQVNVAMDVLEELGIYIPVCGMVKDDHHRTRGLYYENKEFFIDKGSEGFKLITRIQDEAHRFAVEYHRKLRSKGQVRSVLDDIPGIGPVRRRALMKEFQSFDGIKAASVEQLQKAAGMNEKAAKSVYDFFHKNSEQSVEE